MDTLPDCQLLVDRQHRKPHEHIWRRRLGLPDVARDGDQARESCPLRVWAPGDMHGAVTDHEVTVWPRDLSRRRFEKMTHDGYALRAPGGDERTSAACSSST